MSTTTNLGITHMTAAQSQKEVTFNAALDTLDAALGQLISYTVATVPTASSYTGKMIYVTDDVGGAVPAFSDGTDWRRCTDRAVVSTT